MNRADFEIKCIVAGISQKELLDFLTAFRQVTGYTLDSPFVDSKFLKEQGMSTLVACKALMVAKLSMESIDRIAAVFEEYCK